ncbi:MAG: response regulator [Oscillospiraceae bacterium]|nr:response regulator [Oscillospiraceae bacterium]
MKNRVLIVDDAIFMRRMLRDILTGAGYEVVAEAEDGGQSIQMYKKHLPDIVIMDIKMPDVDGITAVQEIIKADPNAKIVICSSMGQRRMVIKAIKYGALDFIGKPFKPERFLEAVGKALAT